MSSGFEALAHDVLMPGGIASVISAAFLTAYKLRRREPVDRMTAITASAEAVTDMTTDTASALTALLRREMAEIERAHERRLAQLTEDVSTAREVADKATARVALVERELHIVRSDVEAVVVWADGGALPPPPSSLNRLRDWVYPATEGDDH